MQMNGRFTLNPMGTAMSDGATVATASIIVMAAASAPCSSTLARSIGIIVESDNRFADYSIQRFICKILIFNNYDFFNQVAGAYGVKHVKTFKQLAKASVNAIKVLGVLTIVANKEL